MIGRKEEYKVIKNKSTNMKIIKYIDNIIIKAFKADYVEHAKVLIILFILILILPFILTKVPFSFFDLTESGQIGDTIGGITAPFIGIIAGYLTFLAFHEQSKANKESAIDLKKERFESKFYNFLSLLNNLEINTTIPNVGNYKQAFHFMLYEYKAIAVLIYRKLESPNITTNPMKDTLGIRENGYTTNSIKDYIMKEAFGIFINGVSTSSTSRLSEYLTGTEDSNDYFLWLQNYYNENSHPNVPYLDDYNTCKIKLFDGHRLRLISFFRLVCKIIELIYEDGGENKELYLSTLLSILSEHQIALMKLIYVYDNKEHERFIMTKKREIDDFFMGLHNENDTQKRVCLNKYIYSDIMDCTKEKFINYEKANKIGFSDIKKKTKKKQKRSNN